MTGAINPKLLGVLAVTLLVAGYGTWKLLSSATEATNVGFDQTDQLPIVSDQQTEQLPAVSESDVTGTRNPFERADRGVVGSDDAEPSSVASDDPDTSTEPESGAEPAFPIPDLVGRDSDGPAEPGSVVDS